LQPNALGPASLRLSLTKEMIALDLQTFRQSPEGGNVTGVIFLELPDRAFPEKGWSDFPVIILGWWTDALLELEVPTRREVLWRFMDGPHGVTLTKVTGDASTRVFEFPLMHNALLEAAERVVVHCDENRMFSKDLETLRENVQRLRASQMQRVGASRSAHIEIRPSLGR
jgi:hypothetical protein